MDKNKNEAENKSPTGSLRHNEGKPQVSQLDPRFILGLAELMTKSAKKYGKYNWALGQEYHTPFDSCARHLFDYMCKIDNDKESGMSHLLHAAANIMIMWTSHKLEIPELDTRHDWNRTGYTTVEKKDDDVREIQNPEERKSKYWKNGNTECI